MSAKKSAELRRRLERVRCRFRRQPGYLALCSACRKLKSSVHARQGGGLICPACCTQRGETAVLLGQSAGARGIVCGEGPKPEPAAQPDMFRGCDDV